MRKTYRLDGLDTLRTHLLKQRSVYQVVAQNEGDQGDYYWQQPHSGSLATFG